MTPIPDKDFEIGKYYLNYNMGSPKHFRIIIYDSIFSTTVISMCNDFDGYYKQSTPPISMSFELDEDEIYKHVTMEIITRNL